VNKEKTLSNKQSKKREGCEASSFRAEEDFGIVEMVSLWVRFYITFGCKSGEKRMGKITD
jgi:hypothetical protein